MSEAHLVRVRVDHRTPRRRAAQLAAKRAIDIVGSCVLLFSLLPLGALIALAIVIDSPGPVVYVQRRVGRGGWEFPILKFRTMRRDADEVLAARLSADPSARREWEATWKLRDDPRITRVGQILRRCSADEFPQLLNVLIGTMSLVGPRPVRREELALFGDSAPLILGVRPGLTGLWAVSGRSMTTYDERVDLERRYVTEWSLWLDLRVLLRTLPAVVRGHGAF